MNPSNSKSLYPGQIPACFSRSLPRRPLAYLVSSYISGIAFCYFFSPPAPALIAGLAAFSSMILYGLLRFSRNDSYGARSDYTVTAFALLMCVFFAAGAVYASTAFSRADPLEQYMTDGAGYTDGIIGHVLISEQRNTDYRVLTVITGSGRILVRIYGEKDKPMNPPPEDLIGKRVLLRGKLSYPETARNPGCFDYRLHLLSKDIRVILTCELLGDFSTLDDASPSPVWQALGILAQAKAAFKNRVNAVLTPEQAALFTGMMFGDKETLDEDTYDLFKRHGVAHILSVSGLHIGMVYAFVSAALGSRKTKRFYITVMILLLCYAALSNFSPSVMRAFSMIAVHIGAKMLNLRYDILTGVLLSAFIMLLINPLALFGTGFILSYTAVCSLAFALPFVNRFTGYRNRLSGLAVKEKHLKVYGAGFSGLIRGRIIKLFVPMVVIQFFMLPLTMYFFNCFPALAVVINIPVIALASFIVPLGIVILLITAAGSLIPPLITMTDALSGIGSSSAGAMIDLMLLLTAGADRVPFSSFTAPSPPVFLLLLFYFLFFFLMSDSFAAIVYRLKKSVPALPVLIVISCLFIAISPAGRYSSAAYTFIDVGQGDCLHIQTPDGRNYLMDGGGKYDYNIGKNVLAPYLLKNGISGLDGVFVSHLHMDHFKGLTELAEIIDIRALYVFDMYSARPEAVTDAFRSVYGVLPEYNLLYLAAGDIVTLGKYAQAEILYPPRRPSEEYSRETDFEEDYDEDENQNSLIIRFVNRGISVLMTGDISADGEADLMALSDPDSDILKIGHHGSKTSTSERFLASADPKIAVIQVGKNVYGHPAMETLEKLRQENLPVYRNDKDGAVLILPINGGFRVKTMKRDFVSPVLLKPFERQNVVN